MTTARPISFVNEVVADLLREPSRSEIAFLMKIKEMVETVGHVAMEQEMAGAQDTIYLCNFRVSVDGEWLCLKELHDVEFNMQDSVIHPLSTPSPDAPIQAFGKPTCAVNENKNCMGFVYETRKRYKILILLTKLNFTSIFNSEMIDF